jgi:hypothetical protein
VGNFLKGLEIIRVYVFWYLESNRLCAECLIHPILPYLMIEITTKNENYYASTTQFSIYSCHCLIRLYLRTTTQNWEKFMSVHRLQEIGFSRFCDPIYHIVKYLYTILLTAETCCLVHKTVDTLTNTTKICHSSDGCEITRKGGQPRLGNSFIIISNSFIQFHIVKLASVPTENFETFGFIRRKDRMLHATEQQPWCLVAWIRFGIKFDFWRK